MNGFEEIYKELSCCCNGAKIVAVSKTKPIEDVISAYSAGFRIFGENYVQEIVEKYTEWHPSDVQLHMIGHLQTNKVSKVVKLVDMIESVDSLKLLHKINQEAEKCGKVMPVLLEFNTSGEEAKSGFDDEQSLYECLEQAVKLKNVSVCGLMTLGPVQCISEDKEKLTRKAFAKLRDLSIKCKNRFPELPLKELSMGMSQDYRIGLEEGSTMVRIGTKIFGERHYV